MAILTNSISPAAGLASGYHGGIIQMKYTPVNGTVSSSTNGSGLHVSAFDTSITPTKTSNRIIIQCFFGAISSSGGNTFGLTVKRGSTTIDAMRANSDSNRQRYTIRGVTTWNADQNHCHSYMLNVIDHPNTTSSTQYRIYAALEGSSAIYFNRGRNNTNSDNPIYSRAMSSMLVMEVSG